MLASNSLRLFVSASSTVAWGIFSNSMKKTSKKHIILLTIVCRFQERSSSFDNRKHSIN